MPAARSKSSKKASAAGAAAESALDRIGRLVGATSDAVLVLDAAGGMKSTNGAFERYFGRRKSDAGVGEVGGIFASADTWERVKAACVSGLAWSEEAGLLRGDGVEESAQVRLEPVAGEGAVVIFAVREPSKVTERVSVLELGGLMDRVGFKALVEASVAEARRGGEGCVLYVDLDHFKVVNNVLGHEAGDRLLGQVGGLLRKHVRKGDEVGYMGGDEFGVLLMGLSQDQSMDIGKRLLRELDGFRLEEGGRSFAASASIGLSVLRESNSGEQALAHAHAACFLVKARGRNECLCYRADSQELQQLTSAAAWSVRVREALRTNGLEVWLQPIVPLKPVEEAPVCEALLRLRDAEGMISLPGEFLPAADAFGLSHLVDRYVLEHSLQILTNHPKLHLSVNLSARALNEGWVGADLLQLVKASGVVPSRIGFEVTETGVIQNLQHARQFLTEFRGLGGRVYLDDFGAGTSSMTYLRELPVDVVKIEGSFVANSDTDQLNRTLVRTMIEMGHTLGKRVVAEHVETAAVLRTIRELGADYGQGWFLCEPCRPEELAKRKIPGMLEG